MLGRRRSATQLRRSSAASGCGAALAADTTSEADGDDQCCDASSHRLPPNPGTARARRSRPRDPSRRGTARRRRAVREHASAPICWPTLAVRLAYRTRYARSRPSRPRHWYAPSSARSTPSPVVTIDCCVRNVVAGHSNAKSSSTGATSPAPTRRSESAFACCARRSDPSENVRSRPGATFASSARA